MAKETKLNSAIANMLERLSSQNEDDELQELAVQAKASKGNLGAPKQVKKPADDEPEPGVNESMEDLEIQMHIVKARRRAQVQTAWEEAHARARQRLDESQSPNYVGGYRRVQARG